MQTRFLAAPTILLLTLWLTACGGGGGNGDRGASAFNSGLAVAANYPSGLASANGMLLFLVNEFEQAATDLNGDGDAADDVVHVANVATGQMTNLGISGRPPFIANDTVVAWMVAEPDEGGADLNNDGDASDNVLVLFDTTQPVSATNPMISGLGIAASSPILTSGNLFAFFTQEAEVFVDFTGDGLLDDFVVRVLDTSTMTVFNTGLPLNPAQPTFALGNDTVAFVVSEADVNDPDALMLGDFNGDGDASDFLMFAARPALAQVFPIGSGGIPRAVEAGSLFFGGTNNPYLAYAVSEADLGDGGTNLNGFGLAADDDAMDTVLAIFDLTTMTEVFPGGGIAVQPRRFSGSDTRFVFTVPEADNGFNGTDLNVDGDVTDVVPFWLDLANRAVAFNVGIATSTDGGETLPQVCANFFVMLAVESDQGPDGSNYNSQFGDDDTSDSVPFFVNTASGIAVPTSLLYAGTQVICARQSAAFIALVAVEGDNGGVDLDGDGTMDSEVFFYYPVVNGALRPGVIVESNGNAVLQECPSTVRFVAFSPEIAGHPLYGDQNRDGDFDDTVLATTQVNKVTGAFMGISMFGTVNPNYVMNGFPVLIGDSGAAFPSLEATIGAGQNLNAAAGDTDLADSVLFIARFNCP